VKRGWKAWTLGLTLAAVSTGDAGERASGSSAEPGAGGSPWLCAAGLGWLGQGYVRGDAGLELVGAVTAWLACR